MRINASKYTKHVVLDEFASYTSWMWRTHNWIQKPQVTEEPEFLSFMWKEVDALKVKSDSISTSKICFTNFNDVNSIRFAVHENSIFQMKNYGEVGNFSKRGNIMEVLKFDSVQKLYYFGYTKLDPKISDFFVFSEIVSLLGLLIQIN